ncbi:TetR/AcrR family transcriptional regulator [Maricaulis sp.]|jgi:AcrR family transcriptional regulator|uniref:TetR/AcrR family transcriptional regulator n=1 Tax=Maricaulis sp. TaxID=1486257 RepID=UPI002609A622|nr:TetR/AcrR family transcriptional regulator [Maricaulis sp.]
MQTVENTGRPRGRPGLTPEVREQALQAAGELLAEKGLKGMQARTIASRAGLSVGSIYKLFGDIDDLIRELNLQTYRDIAVHHEAALDKAGLPETQVFDRVMVLARAYIEFVVTQNARWMALLSFNSRHGAMAPREYRETEDALFGFVESVLAPAPGFADPRFRARAARALWASVHGIVTVTLPNSAYDDPVADALDQIGMIAGGVIRDAAARA